MNKYDLNEVRSERDRFLSLSIQKRSADGQHNVGEDIRAISQIKNKDERRQAAAAMGANAAQNPAYKAALANHPELAKEADEAAKSKGKDRPATSKPVSQQHRQMTRARVESQTASINTQMQAAKTAKERESKSETTTAKLSM